MSLKRRMRRSGKGSPLGVELYDIVYGAMPSESSKKLSPETRARLPRLYARLQEDPRSALPELRALIEREPVPMFYNWLGGALRVLGDTEAMEAVVRENYHKNPDYLFARLNYAELCMAVDDLDGVREALGEQMSLRTLLPGRTRYHVVEVTGFYYAVALYRVATGDVPAAEKLYEILEEIAPDGETTISLRETIWPSRHNPFSKR